MFTGDLAGKAVKERLTFFSRSCYSFVMMVSPFLPFMPLINMKAVPSAAMPLWAMRLHTSIFWMGVAFASRSEAAIEMVFISSFL